MGTRGVNLGQPVANPEIRPAIWHDYIAFVVAHGRERRKVQTGFQEADYIAGAMAAFFAFDAKDQVPANWIFGLMMGVSPLDDPSD